VPIVKTLTVHFSSEILLFILSFPVIISIFAMTSKILKFHSKNWNILYIYQNFIGLPSPEPMDRAEKIVFILIAFLSIIYSNVFFQSFQT